MVRDPKLGFGGVRCPLGLLYREEEVGYGVVGISKQPSTP